MASNGAIVTAKLMRTDATTPWGFRLQGGLEFNQPLTVAKINPGSLSDQAGVQVGDILAKVGGQSIDGLRHKEAQDCIVAAGNYLELELERGGMNTWRPSVVATNDPVPGQQMNGTYTRTSLHKNPEDSFTMNGCNTSAKPFVPNGQADSAGAPKLVHLQYNSPAGLYSEKNIEETLNAHAQVLSSGATGINFIKPDAPVNKASAVYLMVQEEEERKAKGISQTPEPPQQNGFNGFKGASPVQQNGQNGHAQMPTHMPSQMPPQMQSQMPAQMPSSPGVTVTKHVQAPVGVPTPQNVDQNRNICGDCERLIVGPFVRINNRSLHAECFRCNTCGTSLKNVGYFNINDKLYCDVHAKQLKSMLTDRGGFAPSPTPIPAPIPSAANKINGFLNRAQQQQAAAPMPGAASMIPPPQSMPLASSFSSAPQPSLAPAATFQPAPSTMGLSAFGQPASPRQFKPVAPPSFNVTASQNPNRNSMYGAPPPTGAGMNNGNNSGTSTYSVETHTETCTTAPKFNWPPAGGPNPQQTTTVQYRTQSTFGGPNRGSARPKSCYSTFQSSTTNYTTPSPMAPAPSTNGLSVSPQRIMHGAQSVQNHLQQFNGPRSAVNATMSSSSSVSNPVAATQFSASSVPPPPSNGCFGVTSGRAKTSAITDQNAGPKRGRGFLQTQLSGGTVPFCGYCSQPIRGQYIMAMNKTWCPNHFICANTLCKRSLEEAGFVEEQGRLYCEACFETNFAPNCAKCHQRIKGECLNALDKQWHTACFTCTHCRRPFGNSSFYLEDALPYCEKDWNDLFTTKCAGCCLPIAAGDRWVEALSQNFHSNCFRCTVCKTTLEGQSFFAKQGKPFCRAHAR